MMMDVWEIKKVGPDKLSERLPDDKSVLGLMDALTPSQYAEKIRENMLKNYDRPSWCICVRKCWLEG